MFHMKREQRPFYEIAAMVTSCLTALFSMKVLWIFVKGLGVREGILTSPLIK